MNDLRPSIQREPKDLDKDNWTDKEREIWLNGYNNGRANTVCKISDEDQYMLDNLRKAHDLLGLDKSKKEPEATIQAIRKKQKRYWLAVRKPVVNI